MQPNQISAPLLHWYDQHARDLPWRVSPANRAAGVVPDPYRIWLSEIMLQQTTVVTVKDYFIRFTALWPDVSALAGASDSDVMGEWAGLGYYARARNLLKCARVVADELGGVFPNTEEDLQMLPGIGPYTAAAVAAIAFDRPAGVMDGNVERVMARLNDLHTPLPAAKPKLREFVDAATPPIRPGDYAQAVMDLGATICTPRKPACGICPLRDGCIARQNGSAADLPRKTPKKPKPTRFGTIYVGRRADGAWLLERRPNKGLLGGMLGWPGSEWREDNPDFAQQADHQPSIGHWHDTGAEARHTFTHFHLRLRILTADLPADCIPTRGEFMPNDQFRPTDLPTVMRKVFDLVR
jgi:A/G-specific adenine glycosylase